MSKKGKAAAGVTVAAALAVTVGAGAAVAADMGYAPTTLGNSAYTNQVDVRNDYTVQAMRYTSCISNQNADSVDNAEGLSVKLGDASGDVSPIVVTNSLGKDIKEFTFKASDLVSGQPAFRDAGRRPVRRLGVRVRLWRTLVYQRIGQNHQHAEELPAEGNVRRRHYRRVP